MVKRTFTALALVAALAAPAAYADNTRANTRDRGAMENMQRNIEHTYDRATAESAERYKNSLRAEKIVGMSVYSRDNQQVGNVSNILIKPNGGVVLVVSSGGFLGMGDTLYAVEFSDSKINRETSRVNLDMTAAEFKNQPIIQSLNLI